MPLRQLKHLAFCTCFNNFYQLQLFPEYNCFLSGTTELLILPFWSERSSMLYFKGLLESLLHQFENTYSVKYFCMFHATSKKNNKNFQTSLTQIKK